MVPRQGRADLMFFVVEGDVVLNFVEFLARILAAASAPTR